MTFYEGGSSESIIKLISGCINVKLARFIFRQILRDEGVPGMFRGLTATFTREMPGYFFFFLAYEATRGLLAAPGQSKVLLRL